MRIPRGSSPACIAALYMVTVLGAVIPSKKSEEKMVMRIPRRRTTIFAAALYMVTALAAVYFYFMWYMNRYAEVVYLPITVQRIDDPPSIAMVVVLKDSTHGDDYALASSTLHCYAAIHGYRLHVVNAAANETWAAVCPQKDSMFHRHCILRHLLDSMDEEWVLFLDADVGVINPNHTIEEYLPSNSSTHIVFFDRIFSHEIVAGFFLVRNSDFSRRFLNHWADTFFSLPDSFHNSDNGALHMVLLEFSLPHLQEGRERCMQLWKESSTYYTLDDFVVCTRAVMAGERMDGIEIRNKTHPQRVCRDGWLTNTVWSQRDFLLHGWKKGSMDALGYGRWHSPLARPLGAEMGSTEGPSDEELAAHCGRNGRVAALEWAYKDSFIEEEMQVDKRLETVIAHQEKIYAEKVTRLGL